MNPQSMTHQMRRALLRIYSWDLSEEVRRWRPDGRSVAGLQRRGLLEPDMLRLTPSGRQLAIELHSLALAAPGVREIVFEDVRKILGCDTELLSESQGKS
ncbi:MAG: hypothetical protein K0U16_07375 [Gammaproteobacteria bacterium]|nr:hypothetical protein [Gammaproteobacteria bacterium]